MPGNPGGEAGPPPAGDLAAGGSEGVREMEDVVSDALNSTPEQGSLVDRARNHAGRLVNRAGLVFDEARGAVDFAVAVNIQREGEKPAEAIIRAGKIVNRTVVGVTAGGLVVGAAYAARRFRSGRE